MNFKKIIFLMIISGVFLLKIPVFAAIPVGSGSGSASGSAAIVSNDYGLVGCGGPGNECSAEDIFGDSSGGNKLFASDGMIISIFNLVMGILGSVVFLKFISGGILLMTSRGDKSKINKAKKVMTETILGLAIIFFAFAFVQLLLTLFLGDLAKNYLQIN